ncbi:maturase-related protein [Streptococcus macedonicus]|uniref:Maturase-related protein n=2 Tax=Streptococcus TaxID=1301 RepID=A0A081JIR3_STRMC|nr:hypothetical protein FD61_02530 [Streptococcus macedonicus]SUN59672.1 maturase-related protein [Streptococcus gallolyticus]PHV55749.1 maturase-related protein [Streptococcus macedonicus]PHV56306.1 maturase-related protein [Streptococcus macedonicus]PHV60175.1 maturase-related protein [Streptococcus macedonicus]
MSQLLDNILSRSNMLDAYNQVRANKGSAGIERLNWVIRGWINYFSMTNMKSVMESIDERLRTRIRVIIWKQWKKKSRRLWGLLKLGALKWIADKVSGWGDHYQLVAQRSVPKRAISKPVLAKRGLVSCLDYYLKRHALKVS